MRNFTLLFLVITYGTTQATEQLAPHELFWEYTWEKTNFEIYCHRDTQDRKQIRQHLTSKHYKQLLDIGCGPCTDYFLFKHYHLNIDYYGTDVSKTAVNWANKHGINVQLGNINNLPYDNSSFDVCLVRYILECLNDYKITLNETIRVAKKEVIIVFYLPLLEENEDRIVASTPQHDGTYTYINRYSKTVLENFILSNNKVNTLEWEKVKRSPMKRFYDDESILHIYLKQNH